MAWKDVKKRPQTSMSSLTIEGGGGGNVLTIVLACNLQLISQACALLACFFQPLLDDVKLQVVIIVVNWRTLPYG